MIDKTELEILSYYRACELAGSVLFGKIALHTQYDELRIPMTEHALEEAEHAWLWTKVIRDYGSTPLRVTEPYQTLYGKKYGMPTSIIEILALTQVFERRTLQHFALHRDLPSTKPEVKAALQKMIDDEAGHIGWIYKRLQEEDPAEVSELMKKLEAIDEEVYVEAVKPFPIFKDFPVKLQDYCDL